MTSELSDLHERVVQAIRASAPAAVVPFELIPPFVATIDLSLGNQLVAQTDYTDSAQVGALVNTLIKRSGGSVGIGGYNEKRGWYARGAQFVDGAEIRSIHLGVDIWAQAGTAVYAPYDGVIHSVQDNAHVGDYGPTIILTHCVGGETFYTLYGHLSRESLVGKGSGVEVKRGEQFAQLGAAPDNGDWPPHLHFQIITDMLGKSGDYPGAAAESKRDYFLTLCPDPNLILRSELLEVGSSLSANASS